MQCPQCQADNDAGLRFCESCGAQLARLCPGCGHELKSEAKFCGKRGAAVAAISVQAHGGAPSAHETAGRALSSASLHQTVAESPADGERRHLTVLFCDLVDSTPLSQQLDAEEWRDVISHYQRAATDAVKKFGGHVAKNLGDGLLIYFGWPTAREDDPERAVRAGLAIVEAVRDLPLTAALGETADFQISVERDVPGALGRGGMRPPPGTPNAPGGRVPPAIASGRRGEESSSLLSVDAAGSVAGLDQTGDREELLRHAAGLWALLKRNRGCYGSMVSSRRMP